MLGVAVIGAGLIGAAHAQGYRLQSTFPEGVDVSLVKVVDENLPSAGALARRFSFTDFGDKWQDLLDDDRVQVVSIALPNHLHYTVTRALLEAGKHVLCEKPLANRAEEAFELHRLAMGESVVAGTVLNYRRIPAVAAVRALVETGEFGELFHFHGQYLADYGCDPDLPLSWRYQRKLAGAGVFSDVGTHIVDLAHFLCGNIEEVLSATSATVIRDRPIERAEATGRANAGKVAARGRVDNEDIGSMAIRFANGSTGHLLMSRVAVGFGNGLGFTMLGRDRTIRFDYERMTELELADRTNGSASFSRIHAGPGDPNFSDLTVPVRGIGYGYAEVFATQVHHFLKAVERETPLDDGGFADGYRAALVIEAAQKSAETGATVLVADVREAVEGGNMRRARL